MLGVPLARLDKPGAGADNIAASDVEGKRPPAAPPGSPTGAPVPTNAVLGGKTDPYEWSSMRKNIVLFVVAAASFMVPISSSAYSPIFPSIQRQFGATQGEIALTVSVFVLGVGVFPIFWAVVGELGGRRYPYLVCMLIYAGASFAGARAHNVKSLIGIRIVQAFGASVQALGAGTLADMYRPSERGTKMGIYTTSPLLGSSIGAIIGGGLAQSLGWPSVFYFFGIAGAVIAACLALIPDSYRPSRSLTRQRKAAITRLGLPWRQRYARMFLELSPIGSMWPIVKNPANLMMLTYSGVIFAVLFSLMYTASIHLLQPPYALTELELGAVLLSLGAGNVLGSALGGRYCDRVLELQRKEDSDTFNPSGQLKATFCMLPFVAPSVLAYGWMMDKSVHLAGPTMMMFLFGLSSSWVYAGCLTFLVNNNPGRASAAAACNSFFRAAFSFASSEMASPVDNAIGQGWLYTIWAVALLLGSSTVVVAYFSKRFHSSISRGL